MDDDDDDDDSGEIFFWSSSRRHLAMIKYPDEVEKRASWYAIKKSSFPLQIIDSVILELLQNSYLAENMINIWLHYCSV